MRDRRAIAVIVFVALVASAACARPFGREYEYDQQVYPALDGSARVVISGSTAALNAMHGLNLSTGPAERIDREVIRRAFTTPVSQATRVSRPWRRRGRRYILVDVETRDVNRLSEVPPFRQHRFSLTRRGDEVRYRQTVGPALTTVSGAGWTGEELAGFRLHLPSRIQFHNAPSRTVERGNILVWEQKLSERLGGVPVEMEVRVDSRTILTRTLTIFGLALAAAAVLLLSVVWWVRRKGR
jgi:hypothetical protein